jgi:dihydrofolate reductase
VRRLLLALGKPEGQQARRLHESHFRRQHQASWKNTRIVKGSIAEEIANLKQQSGSNLLLFGGASIAQTLVKLSLIDDFRLLINPVVLGNGKPLFQDITDRIPLRLVHDKKFRSGVVGLRKQAVKR